jgi:hypothetical protein
MQGITKEPRNKYMHKRDRKGLSIKAMEIPFSYPLNIFTSYIWSAASIWPLLCECVERERERVQHVHQKFRWVRSIICNPLTFSTAVMVLFPLATSVPAGTDSDFCRVNSKQSQMIYTDTMLGESVICIPNTNIIILLNELIRCNLYYFLIHF